MQVVPRNTFRLTRVVLCTIYTLALLGCGNNAISTATPTSTPTVSTAVVQPTKVSTATPTRPEGAPETTASATATVTATPDSGIQRISVADDGTQADATSTMPVVSGNGRYVAFASLASNLVAGDAARWDVFLYDREREDVTRISSAPDGRGGNGDSTMPALSTDGRFVAFWSFADNLVPNDTEQCGEGDGYNCGDIFVFDREVGTMERIRVGWAGQSLGTYHDLSISGDSRYIAFAASPSPLNDEYMQVMVYDRHAQKAEEMHVASRGEDGTGIGNSYAPRLSGDGHFVAFSSSAANLVPGDTNERPDVFVRDRANGVTERVSVAGDGTQANGASGFIPGVEGASGSLDISADGRFVAFTSRATNLVAGDTNQCEARMHLDAHPCYDVFVYDRETDEVERVSTASDGTEGNGDSLLGGISADGRYVTFQSFANNLVPEDTAACGDINCPDVFVHGRITGETKHATVTRDGQQTDGWSFAGDISADGSTVVFASEADNLVSNDTNQVVDVFVRKR